MAFVTKLDYSNNRQIKQYPETRTVLSGATQFGVPFSYLPTGPDLTTSAVTLTLVNVVSTFSGNSGTTNYTWYDTNMSLGYADLSAITPSNSGITQNTNQDYTAYTTTVIDGNTIILAYTGVTFDLTPLSMISLGGGAYSGTVHTNNLYFLSAGTLDFTGRTIWVDVSGITRTNDLIITDTPIIGGVWTCVNGEGKGSWTSGSTNGDYWSAGSGTNSIVVNNSNSIAGGLNSIAGGSSSTASGATSFVYGNNSIAGGTSTIVLGDNITGTSSHYTYVESLNVKTIASTAFVNDIRIDGNGNLTTNTSDIRLKENIRPLNNALHKLKQLNGITYEWIDKKAGGAGPRLGFIAQEVEKVEPILVFTSDVDGYKGIHIDGIIPIIVEAVKELASGKIERKNVRLETQSIIAEDNNIELNYNGNTETAINGGIKVLHALGHHKSADLNVDAKGSWVTNNNFIPKGLIIPVFTPSSTIDDRGHEGSITRDDNYLYVKTKNGWKRSGLENF